MRYTLWSRGRLLGETDLGFIYRDNGFRCGWLHPTLVGDRLMPVATAVAPALRTECIIGPDATARADRLSAVDQEEALELRLRDPGGAVIATHSIAIIDTHYLLSIAESDVYREDAIDAEQEADIEVLPERWSADGELADRGLTDLELTSDEEPQFPRYQIQVRLVDHDSVP